MKQLLATVGLVIALGLGVTVYVLYEQEPVQDWTDTGFDASASTDERVLALEKALAEEREARQMLETELFLLIEQVDALSAVEAETTELADAPEAVSRNERTGNFNELRELAGRRNDPESRAEFLVQQGFTEDRAAYIAGRESELRFEAMQAQWQARRDGEPVDWRNNIMNADLALREELGTAEYEQYLQANNRPTAIGVNGVLQSSPAEGAGLRMGDRITHYNGERVYNMLDINRLVGSYQGESSIVIDIERDGVPMQVSLPPGPLGITGGNWRRRR